MNLAGIVLRYRDQLEQEHGHELLPGHRKALDAIVSCRTPACGQVVFDCPDCHRTETHPCSCGHRICPVCRNFDTTRWLERQLDKLLPVRYYMVTVTLPGVLRPLAWTHQRHVYDDMFAASREAMLELARAEFLWLLLHHVLPKGYQRVRNYGFLHHNAKKTLQLVQYVLKMVIPIRPEPKRPVWLCPSCHVAMIAVAFILPTGYAPVERGPPPRCTT